LTEGVSAIALPEKVGLFVLPRTIGASALPSDEGRGGAKTQGRGGAPPHSAKGGEAATREMHAKRAGARSAHQRQGTTDAAPPRSVKRRAGRHRRPLPQPHPKTDRGRTERTWLDATRKQQRAKGNQRFDNGRLLRALRGVAEWERNEVERPWTQAQILRCALLDKGNRMSSYCHAVTIYARKRKSR
jgi:hypothetical protein